MLAVLLLTDGSTSIDLLNVPGFLLESWRPSIPNFKADGTYQNSPLADGRQLVDKRFDNVIEQLSYKAQDISQDDLITRVQDLVRLLEKATQYWTTDWQDTPVWLEAKAKCETNTRYGHIMSYRIPELENPYSQPFLQPDESAVMDDMTLIIEHTIWTENQPGTGTAVELSAVETYDGRNLGNVDSTGTRDPTTANEMYIATKRNVANLTDIYVDDGGVFGANLMDAALPYSLLPAVPAVNDAVYFGIDISLADSGPFASLVFDIGTVGAGYTGIWEYCTNVVGPVFAALTVQDNTVAFGVSGVNSVCWSQPGNWDGACVINGIQGFWVRFRITGIPGALTAPTQQNRDVYSVTWPYTEIQSDSVIGDIHSLSTIKLTSRGNGNSNTGEESRVICGLRSVSRGGNFTAYLNVGTPGDQNPTGVTLSLGANTAFSTSPDNVTGADARYTSVGVEALADRITFTLSPSLMQEYYGRFHVFLRCKKAGANTTTVRLKAIIGSGGISSFSDTISVTTAATFYVLDLGTINIPAGKLKNDETGDQTELVIQCGADAASEVLAVTDLVLMPVDEWAGDFSSTNTTPDTIDQDKYLIIDSIQKPKDNIRSVLFNSSDQATSFYQSITNGKSILQSNSRQKLWFLFMRSVYSGDTFLRYDFDFENTYRVVVEKNQQYTTMRGDR